jgi:ribose/xylose/arabinose/galactoside ABC-type transport system permease subunit
VLITLSAPISTCESDDATGITFSVAGIVAFVSIVLTSLTAFVDVVRGRSARRLLAIVAAVVMGAVTLFGFAGDAIGNCLN